MLEPIAIALLVVGKVGDSEQAPKPQGTGPAHAYHELEAVYAPALESHSIQGALPEMGACVSTQLLSFLQ